MKRQHRPVNCGWIWGRILFCFGILVVFVVRVYCYLYLTAIAHLMLSGVVGNHEEMPGTVVHRYLFVKYGCAGKVVMPVRDCTTIEVKEFSACVALFDLAAK